MATKKAPPEKIGFHFGKSDLDRAALFAEMEYLHGKGYTKPMQGPFNPDLVKGRQILPPYPKSKCALQDGYFDKEYRRVFTGEAYHEEAKAMLKAMVESAKKNVTHRPLLPPGRTKVHSTPGDTYGTFAEKLEALSPATRPVVRAKGPLPRNCIVNPGKKGGPGYTDTTIGKYPEYMPDSYDAGPRSYWKIYQAHSKLFKGAPMRSACYPQQYFDPNPYAADREQTFRKLSVGKSPPVMGLRFLPPSPPKQLGGCMDGCFNKYPTHSEDKYLSPKEIAKFTLPPRKGKHAKEKEAKSYGIFYPPITGRTRPTFSTVNKCVDTAVNAKTWKKIKPFTYPVPKD